MNPTTIAAIASIILFVSCLIALTVLIVAPFHARTLEIERDIARKRTAQMVYIQRIADDYVMRSDARTRERQGVTDAD